MTNPNTPSTPYPLQHLIVTGFPTTLDTLASFDPEKPYAGCLLCGGVFQSDLDRAVPPNHIPSNSLIAKIAQERRERWRISHSRSHTPWEHKMLRLSRRFSTPLAAQTLSKHGVFSLMDLCMDDEVSHALYEV